MLLLTPNLSFLFLILCLARLNKWSEIRWQARYIVGLSKIKTIMYNLVVYLSWSEDNSIL